MKAESMNLPKPVSASATASQAACPGEIAPRDKAEILAQALPYIRKFHGKTIVIKYGGNAMTDPELQQDFAEDVVLLKLVGMNPVVVHGGGPQIEDALAKLGKKGTFIQGMRVTDEETMEVVEWVLAGQVQQDIVGLINVAGGKAVGLTGRDGGLIRARKLRMQDLKDPTVEHDVGSVGEIESIDPSVVKALQDGQFNDWAFFLAPGWQAYNRASLEQVCAFQWVSANRLALEAKRLIPPAQWVHLRYEDLFVRPVQMFRDAFAQLGVPFTDELRSRCEHLQPTSIVKGKPKPQKWREHNPQAIERILPVIAPLMRELGYDPQG